MWIVVVVEEIVVGFEVDIVENEGDVARVFAVDSDANGFEMVGETMGIIRSVEVVVAALTMKRLGIEGGDGRAFDHDGRDAEGLHHLVVESEQGLFAAAVVALDGLGHGEEMEKDAARRTLLFGELKKGVVGQGGDGLATGFVEETGIANPLERRLLAEEAEGD